MIEKLRRHEEEIEVSEIGRSGINKGELLASDPEVQIKRFDV
jgi:hypothetical protein